jgi:hypothetical protein
MITRDHFALTYSGNDPTLPPPLCWTVAPRNRALPTRGRVLRAGAQAIAPNAPKLMADLTDPSTWQRSYRFT